MKKLKLKIVVVFSLIVLTFSESFGFFCGNCSQEVMDVIRQATNLEEFVTQTRIILEELGIETDSLEELMTQTKEALKQTEEALKQTEMMGKDLAGLGEDLKKHPLELLMKLAEKTSELETKRADSNLLIQVFNELYPEQSMFADLAGADQSKIDEVNRVYQEHYDKWSKTIHEATRATFRLTGDQLKELEEDDELKDYLTSLLSTPEGNLQALQAANDLAAVQLEESRKLRSLIATQAQDTAFGRMKAEKEDEMIKERWRNATTTDQLEKKNDTPSPLY